MRLCLSCFLLLLVLGCAPPRPSNTEALLAGAWAHMGYEEALQRFGVPTRCETAGSTRACQWVMGPGGAVATRIGNLTFVDTLPPASATLTFLDDHLVHWRLVGPWW